MSIAILELCQETVDVQPNVNTSTLAVLVNDIYVGCKIVATNDTEIVSPGATTQLL